MNEKEQAIPFKTLGARLRRMRLSHQESLAEVSGAVEIDIDTLNLMEQGYARPSQDILLLLISHFDMKDDDAMKLWRLAGYQEGELNGLGTPVSGDALPDNELSRQPAMVVLPIDSRIVYTDMVHANVNNYGVVLSFMQGMGQGSQPLAVSRLGMSREHALSLLDVLQRTLIQSEPKRLSAPEVTEE